MKHPIPGAYSIFVINYGESHASNNVAPSYRQILEEKWCSPAYNTKWVSVPCVFTLSRKSDYILTNPFDVRRCCLTPVPNGAKFKLSCCDYLQCQSYCTPLENMTCLKRKWCRGFVKFYLSKYRKDCKQNWDLESSSMECPRYSPDLLPCDCNGKYVEKQDSILIHLYLNHPRIFPFLCTIWAVEVNRKNKY